MTVHGSDSSQCCLRQPYSESPFPKEHISAISTAVKCLDPTSNFTCCQIHLPFFQLLHLQNQSSDSGPCCKILHLNTLHAAWTFLFLSEAMCRCQVFLQVCQHVGKGKCTAVLVSEGLSLSQCFNCFWQHSPSVRYCRFRGCNVCTDPLLTHPLAGLANGGCFAVGDLLQTIRILQCNSLQRTQVSHILLCHKSMCQYKSELGSIIQDEKLRNSF